MCNAGLTFAQTAESAMHSFNAGEVSPLMQGREDYPKYDSACAVLENFIPLTQGPITRRPGTRWVSEAYDSNDPVRLIPFQYSTSDCYVLAFGDETMQVYRNGGRVLDANSDPYTLATPFTSSEVNDIQYAQWSDVMYMVDGNHPPQKLTRIGHADWTIEDVNITTGPFLNENKTDTTITPSATTGSITLTADANVWNADQVGGLWRITQPVEANSVEKLLGTSVLDSDPLYVRATQTVMWSLKTTSGWVGTTSIQRSEDNVTWEDYLVVLLGESQTTQSSFTNDEEVSEYFRWHGTTITGGNARGTLATNGMNVDGIVRITAYTDANEVAADVLHELVSTDATKKWSEGSWSEYRGWPRTVQFYEQRIVYGGSGGYPQTLWFSKTADGSDDDYEDMTSGDLAADAIIYVLPGQNPIQWMQSQTYLMIGTTNAIGRLGKPDEAITPTTPPAFRLQTRNGSAYSMAQVLGDSILFVDRAGRKIREVAYELQSDSFVSPDLTSLASHITRPAITQIAVQMRPDMILWAIRSDGELLSLTYRKDQEVLAWARHITTGTFESVSVIPGTDEDEVWVAVSRTVDSTHRRYIERMQPIEWDGEDANDCSYLDCALAYDGSAVTSVSGLTHLEGCTVGVWGDGEDRGTAMVTGGAVTLPDSRSASKILVGLPFISRAQTLPIAHVQGEKQSLMLHDRKIVKAAFDLYDTIGGQCAADGENLSYASLEWSSLGGEQSITDTAPETFSGYREVQVACGWTRRPSLWIRQTTAQPMTIRALAASVGISGG